MLVVKKGKNLTPQEIREVNEAKAREWQIPPMSRHQIAVSTFFHLRNQAGELLSLVQLLNIPPFEFNKEIFRLTGLGGMISNIKGKGFGRELIQGVIKYLDEKDLTTIGFCDDEVAEFYRESGLPIISGLTKKFVYYDKDGQRKVNDKELNVMYKEGSDQFISKILKIDPKEVILSRTPDW